MIKYILFFLLIGYTVYGQYLNFPQDTIAYNTLFNNREFAAFDSHGKLHISYTGQEGTNGATREIYYVEEREDGTRQTINITNNAVDDNYSTLSIDKNDRIHIGFTGRDAGNLFQVKYSNNISGSFFTPIFITQGGLNKATPYSKVGPDSVVHFVFFTFTNDPDNIYYTNYDLRTSTILPNPILLTSGETGGDFDAALTVDKNGYVHIVAKSGGISGGPLKYFNNRSGTISEVPTGVSVNVTNPKVETDSSNNAHIVYRNETDKRLYYINNSDGTFTTPLPISPNGQRPATYQNIAFDKFNKLFVVYQSSVSGSGKGFYLVYGKDMIFSDTILVFEIGSEYLLRNSVAVAASGNSEIAVFYAPSASRNSQVVCDIFMKKGFMAPALFTNKDTLIFFEDNIWQDSVKIYNKGSEALLVDSITHTLPFPYNQPPWFEIEPPPPFTILPNDSIEIRLFFNIPVEIRNYFNIDSLYVYSNDIQNNPKTITLKWNPPPQDVKDAEITPTDFQLFQNYPNPFNNSTIINYHLSAGQLGLPIESYVTLKVYNILGSEVATLVDEVQDAGFKSVEFKTDKLSSGVYFYKLHMGNFIDTKKLILIR